jgi:hypothetical protein
LDTGVLRRRSRTLARSPLRHVAYTSALALVELVAGARRSEQEFRKRRAAVAVVFEAQLPVDWQFPEAKIACAYPRLREKYDIFETRCGSLQAVVGAFRQSRTVADFSRRAKRLDVPEPLEYFERYDAEYAGDYVQRAKLWPLESKALFDPQSEPARLLGLPPSVSHSDYLRAFRASEFNTIVMRYAAAMGVAENEGRSDEATHDDLFMTYDGSIDPYLKALSWWNIEHALGRTANRNDAIDLAHLLYLVPGASLVTTDRSLAASPARSISIAQDRTASWPAPNFELKLPSRRITSPELKLLVHREVHGVTPLCPPAGECGSQLSS